MSDATVFSKLEEYMQSWTMSCAYDYGTCQEIYENGIDIERCDGDENGNNNNNNNNNQNGNGYGNVEPIYNDAGTKIVGISRNYGSYTYDFDESSMTFDGYPFYVDNIYNENGGGDDEGGEMCRIYGYLYYENLARMQRSYVDDEELQRQKSRGNNAGMIVGIVIAVLVAIVLLAFLATDLIKYLADKRDKVCGENNGEASTKYVRS